MSLESNNLVLASEFVSLKARVKTEMARRKYQQPLTSYAGTDYDYTTVPAAGGVIKTEHVNKLITPINAIAPSGYTEASVGDPVAALKALSDAFATHEGKAYYNTVDCASGCSGLCRGYCSGTCSGCGYACSYDCTGDCDGTCSGTCSGGCNTTCSGSCTGHCGDGCYGCTASCRTNCSGTCTATCANNCVTGCKNSCGTTAQKSY